jgi:hypothetical protein
VREGDDEFGLFLLEYLGDKCGGGLRGIYDVEGRYEVRFHCSQGFLGHEADEGYPMAAYFHDLIGICPGGRLPGRLLLDISGEEVEAAVVLPSVEIPEPPIELVVADGARVEADELEELGDDLSLGDGGESAALEIIPARNEEGVRIRLLGVQYNRGELPDARVLALGFLFEGGVEVVDGNDVDGLRLTVLEKGDRRLIDGPDLDGALGSRRRRRGERRGPMRAGRTFSWLNLRSFWKRRPSRTFVD